MPHMHGFAKTRKFNLLVSQDIATQLSQTVDQYRQAVSFYLQVFQEHQEILGNGEWLKIAEHLTHTTRRNPSPRYDFDSQFSIYPSGLRRAAISEAYGSACSWSGRPRRKSMNSKTSSVKRRASAPSHLSSIRRSIRRSATAGHPSTAQSTNFLTITTSCSNSLPAWITSIER